MNANKLPKSLRKYAARIDEVSDERSSYNGYWVYLKRGWKSPDDPLGCLHGIHEDTPQECALWVKCALHCDCAECEQGGH